MVVTITHILMLHVGGADGSIVADVSESEFECDDRFGEFEGHQRNASFPVCGRGHRRHVTRLLRQPHEYATSARPLTFLLSLRRTADLTCWVPLPSM